MEELENLEETLNESIRESLGARVGKLSYGKKKGATDEEEELLRYYINNKYLSGSVGTSTLNGCAIENSITAVQNARTM